MSGKHEHAPKFLQWRLECLGHALIEGMAGVLPGAWVFRLGEALGGLVWHFMPLRRKMILRNLRIAFAGEKDPAELRRMVKATFCRTGGNLMSAAHTARLAPEKLGRVIHIENLGLLEQSLATGKGVVLLLAHMGNWEILSRIVHFFPKGARAGAFYRPLNNPLLDAQVLTRRQADGTRMFSKRDNPLHVAGFLRAGGIVGILADQRTGKLGEPVRFFGRLTRASPLPSLLARRAKSTVLALSVTTEKPGKWIAKLAPVDVFWFQERWKVYLRPPRTICEWLGPESPVGGKPLRGLLWLPCVPETWRVPAAWIHPAVVYEAALTELQVPPVWLPEGTRVHMVPSARDCGTLREAIAGIDNGAALPVDFILTTGASRVLVKAGRLEAVPVVSLP